MRGITTSLYVHVYVCVDKNDNIKKGRGGRRKEKEDSRSETKNNKELVQTTYRGIPYRKKGIPLALVQTDV